MSTQKYTIQNIIHKKMADTADGAQARWGLCSVCHLPFVTTRSGNVRTHGSVHKRCLGSGKPAVAACAASSNRCPRAATTRSAESEKQQPAVVSDSFPGPVAPSGILKRVPRGARGPAATKLGSIVENVVTGNDPLTWKRLLHFTSRCLKKPRRGGKRWSLATAVLGQIRNEGVVLDPDPPVSREPRSKRGRNDPMDMLAVRVARKLEEGDYRGAVRITCADDTIAEHSSATLESLRQKHPKPHPDRGIFPTPDAEMPSLTVAEEDVRRAIASFPNGSAGGPDGLRPQHLKDLTGASAHEGGAALLRALTALVNLILKGKTPKQIRPYFFGASLVALRKKDGGVRPIAVGCTLRRLAAKCASMHAVKVLQDLLAPRQLGFGVSRGVEAEVHATRIYLRSLQPDQVLMKVDFKNAFNSVRRDKMLLAVEEFIPELLPFVHSVYCDSSSLMWGDEVVESAEGVQQGDPLGPLLFCLSIHKMGAKLKSELAVFYLDHGLLGGNWEDMVSDMKMIEVEARDLGLLLNRSKTGRVIFPGSGSLTLSRLSCWEHRWGIVPPLMHAWMARSRCWSLWVTDCSTFTPTMPSLCYVTPLQSQRCCTSSVPRPASIRLALLNTMVLYVPCCAT